MLTRGAFRWWMLAFAMSFHPTAAVAQPDAIETNAAEPSSSETGANAETAVPTAEARVNDEARLNDEAQDEACDLRSLPQLRSALELELEGRAHDVHVEAVPCHDPHFYRVHIGGRAVVVPRTEHRESEARFLALTIVHLLEESERPPPPPPEPWVDPRPMATAEDTLEWWPAVRIIARVKRPLTQGELRIGGVFGRGGRAGSGWLAVRSRFRRATLGVEMAGYFGSRGDDEFRTLSARAFVGWDLRWLGFEVEGGVITPRRAQDISYAPAFGARLRIGIVDAIEVNMAVQLAVIRSNLLLSEVRASVLVPLTVRWRLDVGGDYARQTGSVRLSFGVFRWLEGTGGAGSLALGARIGGTQLLRRDPCDGPCESDPTENSELRTFGGLHLELTLRRYF